MKQKLRQLQTRLLDYAVKRGAQDQLQTRAEFFTARFENDLAANSRVLDIGGHWGFYAAPLEKRGHKPVVLDVVKPGFQKAPVVIYDGVRMPFDNKSFDSSLLITVLHHIEDQESVLREACRVTRKRIIVVEDLYRHSLGRFWTILRDRFYNFEWIGHPCGFRTQEEWTVLFNKLGMKLERFEAVKTTLCGLAIMNGIFVLEVKA